MASDQDDSMWFAPKQFGYGAGFPIVWQGWVMLAAHVGVIMLGVALFKDNETATIVWALLFGFLPLPLYAAKTRGGWKWRWPWSE
jgi:hypothetical protein